MGMSRLELQVLPVNLGLGNQFLQKLLSLERVLCPVAVDDGDDF